MTAKISVFVICVEVIIYLYYIICMTVPLTFYKLCSFKNGKSKVMLTDAYLEPSRTSALEFFSLRLNHILKTYLIQSNCL